jgi:hypothetical protein
VTPERTQEHAQIDARDGLGDRAGDGTDGCASGSLARIVRRAARVALSRGDPELDVQPLLQAAVVDPDGGARRTLDALAVSRGR